MDTYKELRAKYRESLSDYANLLQVVNGFRIPKKLKNIIDNEIESIVPKIAMAEKKPNMSSKLLQASVKDTLAISGSWTTKEICEAFGLNFEDVLIKGRKRDHVEARRFIYAYLYSIGFTYEQIGKMFGKDHATIIHSVQKLINFINWEDKVTLHYLNILRSGKDIKQDWAELEHAL